MGMPASNLPALNELLARFHIRLSNQVYSGQFTYKDDTIEVSLCVKTRSVGSRLNCG